MATIELPRFGPNDESNPAFLAMEAVAIGAIAEIELARACLIRQRLDYAGKGSAR